METIESKPNMVQLMRDIRNQFSSDIKKNEFGTTERIYVEIFERD